jgi:HSP20 family protein
MALMRTNPLFAELGGVTNRLNRLFSRDDFGDGDGPRAPVDWAPAVDIVENDNDILIKAELPGVEARDVQISLDNNVLTLKGEHRIEREVNRENYHRMERSFGSFSRSFAIPASIDGDRVTADFKNGLLTITLPKKEGSRGRTIQVNAT